MISANWDGEMATLIAPVPRETENCAIGFINNSWTNTCLSLVCTLPSTLGFTSASTRPSTTPRESPLPSPVRPCPASRNLV